MKTWQAVLLLVIALLLLGGGVWSTSRTDPDPSLTGVWPPGMGGQIAFGNRVVITPPLQATTRQRRALADIAAQVGRRSDLVSLLGEPDELAPLEQAAGWTAFWWNACSSTEAQVEVGHLRVDGKPDGTITRLALIGSLAKELDESRPTTR